MHLASWGGGGMRNETRTSPSPCFASPFETLADLGWKGEKVEFYLVATLGKTAL